LLLIDDAEPDCTDSLLADIPSHLPVTYIHNKIDLSGHSVGQQMTAKGAVLYLSLKTGEGTGLLVQHLKDCVGYAEEAEGVFMARRRHLEAIDQAMAAVQKAVENFNAGVLELLAEELRLAQNALSEITGEFTSDDLLSRIFADFCIGK
jgi:tRNA modification GTPase